MHAGRTPAVVRLALTLALALGLIGTAGCAPAPDAASDLPALPGVDPGEVGASTWFWRDVLAAPLPGETPPRRELFDIEPPAARRAALDALLTDGDPATLTTLMAALRDERPGIAAAAADDLATLGDTAAIPRLIKEIGRAHV